MTKVTNLAEYKEERRRDRKIAESLAPDPVETGQFTRDWLDNFADVRHELELLVEDVERKLKEKKPQR